MVLWFYTTAGGPIHLLTMTRHNFKHGCLPSHLQGMTKHLGSINLSDTHGIGRSDQSDATRALPRCAADHFLRPAAHTPVLQ